MENKQLHIKIYCRSFNKELYTRSKALYEDMGYECVRLTEQTADGYFYTMLADESCDIAINVDEDCFLISPSQVEQLTQYVIQEQIAMAGCQDGSIAARRANPLVINPFFNVINLRMIREKFSKEAVRTFDYECERDLMVAQFKGELSEYPYNFDIPVTTDPYYPFVLWVVRHFQVLYLKSQTHADGTSTLLYWPHETEENLLCIHTWFARYYNVPTWVAKWFNKSRRGKQKVRIDAAIREAYQKRNKELKAFTPCEKLSFEADYWLRWSLKIPQRIAGWPKKIRRKLKIS